MEQINQGGGIDMNNFEFYAPTKVVFGKNAEKEVGKLIKEFGGHKVLLHYGGQSAVKSGLLDFTIFKASFIFFVFSIFTLPKLEKLRRAILGSILNFCITLLIVLLFLQVFCIRFNYLQLYLRII